MIPRGILFVTCRRSDKRSKIRSKRSAEGLFMAGKVIIAFCLITLVISAQVVAAPPEQPIESDNYCEDPESWKEWDALVQKHPNDMDIQTLHALRIGLCIKIQRGSISLDDATKLFEDAHQLVIQKKQHQQQLQKEEERL
jgi:hypothetical protein